MTEPLTDQRLAEIDAEIGPGFPYTHGLAGDGLVLMAHDLRAEVTRLRALNPQGDNALKTPLTVYISIGNSDDKLTQRRWSDFNANLLGAISKAGQLHGVWHSSPTSLYQNTCVCVEVRPESVDELKRQLRLLAVQFEQDSIAWAATPETEFLGSVTA